MVGMNSNRLSIGQAKRVLEWWCCSANFRTIATEDTKRAADLFNLDCDPELVRPLWDENYHGKSNKEDLHPVVEEYRAYFRDKLSWSKSVREECASDDVRLRNWRERQVARNQLENGPFSGGVIHAPFALELTDGCSVGCWFCGVGATRYLKSWPYTPENAALWQAILKVLGEKIGAAAKWGFGYWATDPLDNPDYEEFMGDFADILGMFPQTTTAQAHKHAERVRDLLKVSEKRGCRVNRFSVSTESILRQIHGLFTADELTNVEIVGQMKSAPVAKAYAGSFRNLARKNSRLVKAETRKVAEMLKLPRDSADNASIAASEDIPQPGTIACVSGFLFNMVHKTVKLISPCRASEQWPLGYIVFGEAKFETAEDVSKFIDSMMQIHMPVDLERDDSVSLVDGCDVKDIDTGFQVMGAMSGFGIEVEDNVAFARNLGMMLRQGIHKVGHFELIGLFKFGVPEKVTRQILGSLFERGGINTTRRVVSQDGLVAEHA